MLRLAIVLTFATAIPSCFYRERRRDVYVEPPRHEHERREERREEHHEEHHDHDDHRP